ncbi:MAG TPA: type I-C CRISPR-associated endonuclease Cas1c [Feifaniaceae bacterium]|nr:type I-C CRISPR-associated endonuclease Cas1c [Feifaniaceae bacterium]
MKKLLNTLYVTTPETYLALDGENVVVLKEEETMLRLPLHTLENICYFGYKGASPALMGACANHGIRLSFLTPNGRFLAAACGENRGNVLLRKQQYRISDDEAESAKIARCFLFGKLYNSRWVLERATRDHPLQVDAERLKAVSASLLSLLPALMDCADLGELRGMEGSAAEQYFGCFNELILQNKGDFRFSERTRRPPMDNLNALLSFAYTLLGNDCAAALEGVGLDPYVGFLHRDRPGRISLALDLMEELRSVFADRFVLYLINNRMLTKKDFVQKENGAVLLTDDARKAMLAAYQERKQELITHPFLEEKLPWGLVPHTQALLLARFLRGDLDTYPPFLWK